MSSRFLHSTIALLALTLAACSKGSTTASTKTNGVIVLGQPAHPENPNYKNSGLASMGKDTIAQHQVVEMLHADQMILIPEVQKKTQEFVAMYRNPANHMTREQAAAKFVPWLETYAAQHPAEIAKAKSQQLGPTVTAPAPKS